MARLLLGVSGGIAAYKALEAARLAVKAGHSVRVIQTPASERFVGRASFEAFTGAPVLGVVLIGIALLVLVGAVAWFGRR